MNKLLVHGALVALMAPADAGVVHGYTEYPGVDHDSWTQTYANDENLLWMFGRQRRKVK